MATLATWALRALVLGWVLIGLLWCGLHFVIVPRIAEFRPWIQEQASQALGLRVQIGAIEARSNGVIPSIELLRVTVADQAGRQALLLPSVSVALSPRSLLGKGFEQLYIDSPQLDVRRSADGAWWVAGLRVGDPENPGGTQADWLFSQTEVALVNGQVTWTDETRAVEPVVFGRVSLVIRNRLRSHTMRLDADPPAHWGARFELQGQFKQALLSGHPGDWKAWSGQAYAQFSQVNVAELGRYVDLGAQVRQGQGTLRAWVDLHRGEARAAVADVQLEHVDLHAGEPLQPITLASVSGRMGVRAIAGGHEWSTESLQFTTADGLHWPGGNVRVQQWAADGAAAEHGSLQADKLDVGAMAMLADRLPVAQGLHTALRRFDPRGVVDQVQATWTGPIADLREFKVTARMRGLQWASCRCDASSLPGVRGLDATLDMDQSGGTATVSLRRGAIDAHGWLVEPEVAVDQLSGTIEWTHVDGKLVVRGKNLRFVNPDGQGDLALTWQGYTRGEAAQSLGLLDLQGSLSRANAAQVHRYLPVEVEPDVRTYVQEALLGGTATQVQFKFKGDLDQFPYRSGDAGEFRIAASLGNATYAFAPHGVLPKDSLPWPVLGQVQGELVLDNDVLRIKLLKGSVGPTALALGRTDIVISQLYDASQLTVAAEARGPLPDLLRVVDASPLGGWMDQALAHTTATGVADYKFKLAFPLADVNRATVQGSVVLAGNDLQFSPETPKLSRARGVIAFTDTGFSLAGAQAKMLGGDVKIEGGLTFGAPAASPAAFARAAAQQLKITGVATAEGLHQATELGSAARLAQFMTGSAGYSATLGFRSGVPEIQIATNLVGMALALPHPLGKAAEVPLALRLETAVLKTPVGTVSTPLRDRWQLEVGKWASATYVRDLSGVQPRVQSGALGIGLGPQETVPLPPDGVVAHLNLATLDADTWIAVLGKLASTPSQSAGGTVGGLPQEGDEAYLPSVLIVRADELVLSGYRLHRVTVGGGREGSLWKANVDASEMSGYLEYSMPRDTNAGRLYARLARLSLGTSEAQDVETLLDGQPAAIPALDIEVEDFVLRGKKIGRIDIEAINLGSATTREWRLNRFNIQNAEAELTAAGNWATGSPLAGASATRPSERRRTALNFKLDVRDAGELLGRLGMPGVVRKGNGKVEGKVSWSGSPITVDYPTMGGAFNVNIENGQFLKADPGIAKLLGVLSLQSLPRRLALDFRDVFSEGFAFDFFRGDVSIDQGMAKTSNLQMKGVNAAVMMDGYADIAKETQNLRVVVVPEINAGSASLIASTVNPLVGLSTFLAQLLLRGPLVSAATQEFVVDGTWLDPKVTQVPRKP